MTPAPAPRPSFPTIRFSAFDRMARVNQRHELDAMSFELVEGVWSLPPHIAADALRVSPRRGGAV